MGGYTQVISHKKIKKMEISELTFRLILIFIPGFIFLFITRKFTKDKEFNAFEVFTYALIIGLISYTILGIIHHLFKLPNLNVWSIFNIGTSPIVEKFEILFSSIISLVLSFLYILSHRKKWFYRMFLSLGITDKYGDDSTYYTFLNQEDVDYVHVYDLENNLVHHGHLYSFSENNDILEILLINSDTYTRKTMVKQFSNREIYLTFKKTNKILILKA